MYPAGDSEKFCDHVFRVFGEENLDYLDFKKFIMAMDVTYCQSVEEKLEWTFRLYDIDASGFINREEIESIIKTMDQVEGRSVIKSVLEMNPKIRLKPVSTRATELLGYLDANNDGLISRHEFVEGYMKIHATKNGQRRWSVGRSIWQSRGLNMEKIIRGTGDEIDEEKDAMEQNDTTQGKTKMKSLVKKNQILANMMKK